MVTGPRQVGKSTTLNEVIENTNKINLDNRRIRAAVHEDPQGYLEFVGTPLMIDEVQREKDIFTDIKNIIDTDRNPGMYYLTGSQSFKLMEGVSESLAGRISILYMLGLSTREINQDTFSEPFLPSPEYLKSRSNPNCISEKELWKRIQRGSFPELYNSDLETESFYDSYVDTYLEKDIRELANVGDLLAFKQFMVALAARSGQLLNMSDIANDVGVSSVTIKKWISILESSNLIYILRPFSLNVEKRVIKTPKIYFTDTGLAAYLTRWLTPETLMNGAMAGNIFETFVVSEVIKSYYNAGRRPNIYFYRDTNGCEVDLLFYENGKLYPLEIKKKSNPTVKDFKNFENLKKAFPSLDVSSGGVVCNASELLPMGNERFMIPVSYI